MSKTDANKTITLKCDIELSLKTIHNTLPCKICSICFLACFLTLKHFLVEETVSTMQQEQNTE